MQQLASNPIDLDDLPQGWFNHGAAVLTLLEEHRPQVVVELGTWMGQSAIAMARAVRRWGGTVTCVDTWSGDLNEQGGTLPRTEAPYMVAVCARHLRDAGIAASVRLIPALTSEAARYWTGAVDVLYVDADHSAAGCYADLVAWTPHVRPGGLLIGDDYDHPRYPGVKFAWDTFARDHDLTLKTYQSTPPVKGGIQLVYGVKP